MARTEKYTDNDLLQAINEYIIKNPNINETKTLTPESILFISFIVTLVSLVKRVTAKRINILPSVIVKFFSIAIS